MNAAVACPCRKILPRVWFNSTVNVSSGRLSHGAFASSCAQSDARIGPCILLFLFSIRCTGSRYGNGLNAKLFPPRISSCSLLLHITCMISSQSSLLGSLDHPHWSLFSNHQLTPVSRSQTASSGMPQLTCGTSFLVLFMFLITLVHHHHPALLRHHTLILDRLLTFLVAFSTLVFSTFLFPVFPSISVYSFLS